MYSKFLGIQTWSHSEHLSTRPLPAPSTFRFVSVEFRKPEPTVNGDLSRTLAVADEGTQSSSGGCDFCPR